MFVDILASGSSGNVAAFHADKLFLIDCGKPFKWIVARLNYKLPDALLVTHEHCDHTKAVKQFLNRQVDVFLTDGTADKLNLEPQLNLHFISAWEVFNIGNVKVTVIPAKHDAAEPVNFILCDDSDRVLFATDTGEPPMASGIFTQIFLEANYSVDALLKSDLNPFAQARIFENHLSIEEAEKFVARFPNAKKTPLHISKRHGDEQDFINRFRRL